VGLENFSGLCKIQPRIDPEHLLRIRGLHAFDPATLFYR
jgi:hypothetical protein